MHLGQRKITDKDEEALANPMESFMNYIYSFSEYFTDDKIKMNADINNNETKL